MRRRGAVLCGVSVICAALLGLAGCGNQGTEDLKESGAVNGSDSAKTRLVFLRVGTEPERKTYWEEAIAAFMEANPDIEIEYQECGYGDDFETKLNTGFA